MQRAHKLCLADYVTSSDCGPARGFLSTLALLAALLQVTFASGGNKRENGSRHIRYGI